MQTLIPKNKKKINLINFQLIWDGIFEFSISSRFDPLPGRIWGVKKNL
jgi:hypothetical protein